jgi:hypothetical protein
MGKSFAPSLISEKTNQLNTNAPGKPKQVTSKQKPNSPISFSIFCCKMVTFSRAYL